MSADETERPTYDPPRRIRQLPSWLTAEVARKASSLVAEALAADGVRRQHFAVLTSLSEQGAASQAALGRRLWIDRSDLNGILNDLEQAGLAARIPDTEDRRRNLVELTPKGTRTLMRLDKRIDTAQDRLLEPLSPAERRQLSELLKRVLQYQG